MKLRAISIGLLLGVSSLAAVMTVPACSSGSSGSTRTYIHYGAGYRGFYRRPWGYHPIYIGRDEVDPDWGVDGGFIDMPMPDMGMPDFDTMDMGSFDW